MLWVYKGDTGITVALHRGYYQWFHDMDPAVSVWTEASRQWPADSLKDSRGTDVLRSIRGRVAGRILLRARRQLSSHQHYHQWKLKCNAALRPSRELKFWDAPRIPWHLPPNGLCVPGGGPTNMYIRCTWTFVPGAPLLSALLHANLSPLSLQASRLHSTSCSELLEMIFRINTGCQP